jgi:uncharacterized protein YbjT (DUF2867 family)
MAPLTAPRAQDGSAGGWSSRGSSYQPLGEAGVSADWVSFGFSDPGTWDAAFAGVRTMFLSRPPAISDVRRDLLPAVAAARQAGLRHVVFLSLQGPQHNRVVPRAQVESWLRSS